MKILIRNSDNMVIYAQDDLVLDTEAHGDNWRDPHFNTSNATLAEATLPNDWTGAVWSYINGVWSIHDQAGHDRVLQAHADKTAAQVRQERDIRLADLDWTQGKDIADSISVPAATVRQALRDIPTQAGFPLTVLWPVHAAL